MQSHSKLSKLPRFFGGLERYWGALFFGSFLVDSAASLAAAYETYAFGAGKQKK